MEKLNKEIIIFRENLLQSILIQVTDMGFLLGSAWFNYNYIGNSKMINVVILIGFFFIVISMNNSRIKKFYTKEDIRKYLEESL